MIKVAILNKFQNVLPAMLAHHMWPVDKVMMWNQNDIIRVKSRLHRNYQHKWTERDQIMTSSAVLGQNHISKSTCPTVIIIRASAVIFSAFKHETELKAVSLSWSLVIRELLLVATFGTSKSAQLPSTSLILRNESDITWVVYENVRLFNFSTFYKLYIYMYLYITNTTLSLNTKFTKYKEEVHYLSRRKTTRFPDIFQLDFDALRCAW